MIKSKTTGMLFATGILLVGIISGMMIGSVLKERHEGPRGAFHIPFVNQRHGKDAMLRHFNKELDLTTEQQTQMKTILAEQKIAMNGLMREVRPKIDAQMEFFKTKVRTILTDAQRVKFDAIGARNEARRKKFEQ